jgi:hypothetical protein
LIGLIFHSKLKSATNKQLIGVDLVDKKETRSQRAPMQQGLKMEASE